MPRSALPPLTKLDPAEAWKPWKPDSWNLKWAAHLFRRAAFGVPAYRKNTDAWEQFQRAIEQGFETTFQQVLAGGPGQEEFNRLVDRLMPNPSGPAEFEFSIGQLQAWWLWRMIYTPHPLLERMTLFWHNHFATSFAKVRKQALMFKQNQLIRKHALGKFRPFLLEMSKDPAMLIWLDSNSNVKGHANENYARELMELFSLGVGNYTEKDIKEAARAFTGWHTGGGEFYFNAAQHDNGPKTVLDQTGNWNGDDIVRIVLEQPAAARFLVRKLYRHFISENEPPPDSLLEPLAEEFRRSDYDIAAVVQTILRSRLFFSEYAYRQRIKSPTEYVVGLVRSCTTGSVGMHALAGAMEGMGQELFMPPNVKGWDGGKAWLNSATLLARHNFAWAVVNGEYGRNDLIWVTRWTDEEPAQQADFLLDLFVQGDVSPKARQKLVEFLQAVPRKDKVWEKRLRETVHTILLMPEYQLA